MANKDLVYFIKEARNKGFGDYEIKKSLIKNKWPLKEIELAFSFVSPRYVHKNQVTLFLNEEIILALKKRAKKNMLSVSEQIEDILRRSTVNQRKKKTPHDPKIDDSLINIFSRRKRKKKKKNKVSKNL